MHPSRQRSCGESQDGPRVPPEREAKECLSLIVPTYNERDNVLPLLMRILQAMEPVPIDLEIILVDDDSPDGTADLVLDWLANTFGEGGMHNSEHVCHLPLGHRNQHRWIRLVRRSLERGFASAVVEGMRRATGRVLAFMDADLSHPPEAIPSMVFEILRPEGPELVIGSRYREGSVRPAMAWYRGRGSRLANWLARSVSLSKARDSTSAFVMFRREVIGAEEVRTDIFHVGLEIIARGRYRMCTEIPYQFSARRAGRSKFNSKVVCQFAVQLARLFLEKQGKRLRVRRITRVVP